MNVAEMTRQAVKSIGMKPIDDIKKWIETQSGVKDVKKASISAELYNMRKKMETKTEIVIPNVARNGQPIPEPKDEILELIATVKNAIEKAGTKDRLKKIIDLL